MSAYTEVRTIQGFRGVVFDRIYLYCPQGHEVVSAPVDHHTGRKLLAGDFTGESCGHGSCEWAT